MTELIYAVWTPEQVDALSRFQQEGDMHPFTCGAPHAIRAVEQSRDSRYEDLVRAEARAIADETLQRFRDAMQHGDWIDSNGDEIPAVPVAPLGARTARKPRRRTDRPAWQSPHGPAQRRR